MAHNSTYTGVQVDAAVAKHFLLEGQGGAVSANALTTRLNDYLTLSNASATYLTKTDANTTYLTKTDASNIYVQKFERVFWRIAYFTNPYSDASFTNTYVPFNTIRQNEGPGALTNGKFVCQSAGYYLAIFTRFSNSQSTGRTRLVKQNSADSDVYYHMVNGNYTDISAVFQLNVGEKITVYFTGTTSFYAGGQHNELIIYKLY